MAIEPIENPYRVVNLQKSRKARRVQSREHDERDKEPHDEFTGSAKEELTPETVTSDVENPEKSLEPKQPDTDENKETKKRLDIRI